MKRSEFRLLGVWTEHYMLLGFLILFLCFCAAVQDAMRVKTEPPSPLPCADKAEVLTPLGGASCRADQWGSLEDGPDGSVVLLCTCQARP